MDTLTCSSCKITLPISNFTLGKKCCKSCRNSRAKQSYNKEEYKEKYDPLIRQTKYHNQKEGEWLLKRTPLRNKLLSQCLDEGLTIENFNSLFIKKEDYDKIVNNPDYEFAYSKVFKTDFIPKEDFDNGYIPDYVMCGKYGERKLNQILFII